MTTTYWYSEEVPGLLLRMDTERKSEGGTFKETGTQALTEVKYP